MMSSVSVNSHEQQAHPGQHQGITDEGDQMLEDRLHYTWGSPLCTQSLVANCLSMHELHIYSWIPNCEADIPAKRFADVPKMFKM